MPPLRVLAVDDNRTNLHILKVFLKKLGHEVLSAENGREAVDCFERERPDLVLLDIMMPIMDGFEAARLIKAQSAEHWVPIIFLSALNRDENLVEGLEAGGDDYLTKPINFVVLEAKVRSIQRALFLQQRAGEAMRRMQSISDAVMEAIVTIDSSGTIISGNAACSDILGWDLDALVGQNVSVLMPEPQRGEHQGYLSRYVGGGEPHIIGIQREVLALRRDGSTFPAELAVSEIRFDKQRLFIGVMRDISERKATEKALRDNAEQLRSYFNQNENEQALAKSLIEKQLHRPDLQHPRLRYSVQAADHFSGDIVAAAQSPEGRFYALLADATGHGLAAAISVLPVLALFYRLCSANQSLSTIIRDINQQLRESMPVGRFVAATFVCLDEQLHQGEIWIGGTPEVLVLDACGQPSHRFTSTQLPLGIGDMQTDDSRPSIFQWPPDGQVVLVSDGLIEAENANGEQFGMSRLLAALAGAPKPSRFDAVRGALTQHLGPTGKATDDVSVMMIDC
ncbi:MAG TPA: SpoIIE family protein phosphatase [Rhodocyclaceae bacterium]|nr:SpoIIE family protein phosphatase [Rhodocyclaceae bacterium]